MAIDHDRHIQLTGAFNFRDLGGYRTADGRTVRWRRLFRSDGHEWLTPKDIAQLRALGLATVIDLRSAEEVERTGQSPLHDGRRTVHYHMPFETVAANREPDSSDVVVRYLRMLEGSGPCLCTVFDLLADADRYPTVIHCAAGKDRTGLVVALVLRTLGVDDGEIAADYALTEQSLVKRLAAWRAHGDGPIDDVDPEMLRASSDVMTRTLASLDERYGSTNAFLVACGVRPSQIARVRQHLLGGAS